MNEREERLVDQFEVVDEHGAIDTMQVWQMFISHGNFDHGITWQPGLKRLVLKSTGETMKFVEQGKYNAYRIGGEVIFKREIKKDGL